jgi:hypothetical protein
MTDPSRLRLLGVGVADYVEAVQARAAGNHYT